MTEEQNYLIEAALYHGFEVLDDDATQFKCTDAQIVSLLSSRGPAGRDPHPTVDFTDMVATLAKPGADILASLTPEKCHMWHMASCVPGEAGELFDAVKKHCIYGKELDRENVVEELGDLEFYMEGLRQGLGITRKETLESNIAKLGKRYAGFKYSDAAAQKRADKNGEG